MSYIPRTTQPSNSDLRWITIVGGGYNACIEGSPQPVAYSVLANCTGYVHGRWLELLGITVDNMSAVGLPLGNANTYYQEASNFIIRSQNPTLGSIACWDGRINPDQQGNPGPGHVAVIEEINGNTLSYSESNYGGEYFTYIRNRSLEEIRNTPGFLGFIIHPDINPGPIIKQRNRYKFVLYGKNQRNKRRMYVR